MVRALSVDFFVESHTLVNHRGRGQFPPRQRAKQDRGNPTEFFSLLLTPFLNLCTSWLQRYNKQQSCINVFFRYGHIPIRYIRLCACVCHFPVDLGNRSEHIISRELAATQGTARRYRPTILRDFKSNRAATVQTTTVAAAIQQRYNRTSDSRSGLRGSFGDLVLVCAYGVHQLLPTFEGTTGPPRRPSIPPWDAPSQHLPPRDFMACPTERRLLYMQRSMGRSAIP